jgi:hypothetical protein
MHAINDKELYLSFPEWYFMEKMFGSANALGGDIIQN